MNSCLYAGYLAHRRTAPVVHRFRYPIATFYLDLDEVEALARELAFFSVNRCNLVSFHDRDHMDGLPGATKPKVRAFLRLHDLDPGEGKIFLLTQCRIFNYVFNPVSFYFCHACGGDLRCVVAEVNNTFGERHLYLLSARDQRPSAGGVRYEAQKVMHVSPFVSMDARYAFRFAPVAQRLSIAMSEWERGQPFFDAHLWGERIALTNRSLCWLLVRYPFLTLKIIGAIHWQALRLYRKGVPFYPQPAPSAAQRAQHGSMQRLAEEVAR